jgi:GWxTD domain-containing protein
MLKQPSMKKPLTYSFFMVLLSSHFLFAQMENGGRLAKGLSDIFCEAFSLRSDLPGKGRIDIYVQIPYTGMKFVKEDERYVSRLEISTTVLKSEQHVWQKNQTVELSVKDFSQTISNKQSTLKQFSTDLQPGNYDLVIQVTDQELKKVETIKKPLVVKDFGRDTLALSDIMLVRRMNVSGAQKEIVPNLTGILSKESFPFYLFFEIYDHASIDSVDLVCKFINSKQEEVMKSSRSELLSGDQTQVVWKIDTPAFAADQYLIKVEASGYSRANRGKHFQTIISRPCVVQIKNMPETVTNIDKAIDQLVYIAKGSEIDYIREPKTLEEKQKRFLEFWEKRDPDPKTPENELMEEYYSRVDYANQSFPSFIEGWRTDRGMILIRYGMPENVERHPFNAENKPYEIWYYYNQNREFVFVDETGFGDYRLRFPTTDLWGRIR